MALHTVERWLKLNNVLKKLAFEYETCGISKNFFEYETCGISKN